MKDILTDALKNKLGSTLEALGGARALYGEPIRFNGEDIIPVARITVTLGASAEGSGGGNTGPGLGSLTRGGGGGNADAGIRIVLEPVGFLRSGSGGSEFHGLDAAAAKKPGA